MFKNIQHYLNYASVLCYSYSHYYFNITNSSCKTISRTVRYFFRCQFAVDDINIHVWHCIVVTHVGVGVLRLGLWQWGVTVWAVMLTEIIGCLRVGSNQQLLDVSL